MQLLHVSLQLQTVCVSLTPGSLLYRHIFISFAVCFFLSNQHWKPLYDQDRNAVNLHIKKTDAEMLKNDHFSYSSTYIITYNKVFCIINSS